jgi:hypothetical protein
MRLESLGMFFILFFPFSYYLLGIYDRITKEQPPVPSPSPVPPPATATAAAAAGLETRRVLSPWYVFFFLVI